MNLYEMKFQNYFLVTQASKKCFEPTLKVIYYEKYNLKKWIKKFKFEKKN